MGFADERYEATYAADMKFFACVEMVEEELTTAIDENGYSFADMTNKQIAEDLHRYSAVAELWEIGIVEAAVPVAIRNLNKNG